MPSHSSVEDLITAARASAAEITDQIAKTASEDGVIALETLAIDTFAGFEARSQHHFRRGPFARKLKTMLIAAADTDLADRVYQYYLVVNVLKHGKGASHRELLAMTSPIAPVRRAPEDYVAQTGSVGLVDVTQAGFFDDLTATILKAHHFLEGQSTAD